ncbi:hypothetical protein LTS15_006268 [Exophiala xenobiotica]|nr:hypothetical protein LTS15_006268 [Exophiala xenobiotica]
MSGLEILGVVASAAQLADLCSKTLKAISGLYRDVIAIPRDVDNCLTRISQLSEVAQLVSSTPSLHGPVIAAAVHDALTDTEALLTLLEATSNPKSGHFIRQQWQKASYIVQEPTIRKLLDKLESTKVTLSLCINTVNSHALHSIGIEVRHIRDESDQLSRRLPVIQDNARKTLTRVQDLPKIAARLHDLTKSHNSIAEKVTEIHRLLPGLRKFDEELDPVGTMTNNSTPHIRSPRLSALDKVTDSKRRLFVPVAQNPLFTGRQSIISQIAESFSVSPDSQQRTVLIGLGGVGKTQIAAAFIHSALVATRFSKVFWTFANSRSQVIKSFTDIANSLGICTSASASRTNLGPDGFKDTAASSSREVNALISWMSQENNTDWILVFDNLDDLESFDICEFIPKVPFGHVLITSRRQNAARLGTSIVVDVMNDEEALELLYKCSNVSKGRDQSKAKELVSVLGNLPLAIDQAGAYIADGFMEFDDYLLAFHDRQSELLSTKPPAALWTYEHTVYTTWEISVNKLQTMNTLAVRILDLAANFDSHDIPVGLVLRRAQHSPLPGRCFLSQFYDFANPEGNYDTILGPLPAEFEAAETEITAAIAILVSFSLVRRKQSSKNLVIHPLSSRLAQRPCSSVWQRDMQRPSRDMLD